MKQMSRFPTFFFPTRALIVLLVLLSFAPTCLAQQSPPPSAEVQAEVLETLKQLKQQMAELQARTKELEARLNNNAAPTPTPAPAQMAVKPATADGAEMPGE